MDDLIYCFSEMPSEIKQQVFSYLPLPDVGRGQQVCKDWNNELEDHAIWEKFYTSLQPSHSLKPQEINKAVVINLITDDLKAFKEKKAETKKTNNAYHNILLMELGDKKLGKVGVNVAERVMRLLEEIERKPRNVYGRCIIKKHKNNLQKVTELIPSLQTNCIRSNRVLFRILGKFTPHLQNYADQNEPIFKALEKSKNLLLWSSFIVDLAETFEVKEEHDISEQIKARFSEAFATPSDPSIEAAYYLAKGQLNVAENIAESLSIDSLPEGEERWNIKNTKWLILKMITDEYERRERKEGEGTSAEDLKRIQSLIAALLTCGKINI